MRALLSRNIHRSANVQSAPQKFLLQASSSSPSSGLPVMRTQRTVSSPLGGHHRQQASYYFDASHQSTKTLRVLLAEYKSGDGRLGQRPPTQLLAHSFDVLLNSICPRMPDDGESRAYFFSLLRMHLSSLAAPELEKLAQSLQSHPYDCYVAEPVNNDESLRTQVHANETTFQQQRTLLQTRDLFYLLDELHQQATGNEVKQHALVSEELATTARAWLASCATSWLHSNKTLGEVLNAARQLAELLDMRAAPEIVMAATLSSRASVVVLNNGALLLERSVATHLGRDETGKLFAYVLRDLLELMLAKKLFDHDAAHQQLTAQQRIDLQNILAQIIDTSRPPEASAVMQAQAGRVLANAKYFGTIQILPTIGAALGHAWIPPALSLTTDSVRQSVETGTRFMHTGFQLAARECVIREWPTRFLSAEENERIFPAAHAWTLPVPVAAQQLQSAAEAIIRQWREHALPYRFVGVDPTVDATGCRITVWQAIQHGMTADAQALFQHYNRGLPEPDSPTELWLRLDGMMRWLQELRKR